MSVLLLSIFILVTLIQIGFWLVVFMRLANYKAPKTDKAENIPVSVIICAKNEESNVQQNLPKILNQKYPQFEVIVVNDHSTDNTQAALMSLKNEFNHLSIIHLDSPESDKPGKKFALAKGIETAQYDWILLTDADCVPVNDQWIFNIILKDNKSEVVLGYGPVKKSKGFLNRWSRFETVITAIQYFSWAIMGKPYMGVGRNLLYRKKLFRLNRINTDVASGDDDLLIQSLHNQKVDINIDPSTFMYSDSLTTWGQYLLQKSRHMSTSFSYAWPHKISLFLFASSQLLFWILIIPIFILNIWIGLFALLLKWTTQMIIFIKGARKLDGIDLSIWFPLLDFGLAIYYLIMIPILLTRSRRKW